MLETQPQTWTRRSLVGAGLMLLSPILCLLIPGAALLPISTAAKGGVVVGVLVVAEVIFWLGALVAGPEVVRRFRRRWQRLSKTG